MPVSEAVRARCETIAAFATAGLHFVFYDVLSMRGAFIALAVGGWLGYVAWRIRREPRCAAEYGLTRAGLAPTARAAGVVLVLGVLACLGIGLTRGALPVTASMGAVSVFYPIWGLVQQLIVQAMAVRNLARGLPRGVVAAFAGLLFGAVHVPHLPLVVATGALGAVFALFYLRWRNLWPLGICHGWLGVVFYSWVLGRDPWREVVG